jgi:hypothetical protein
LPEGRPGGQSGSAAQKELARFINFGETGVVSFLAFPGFAGHPARLLKAGFVFLGLEFPLHHKPFMLRLSPSED